MFKILEYFVKNHERKSICVYNQRLDFIECNKSFRKIFLDFAELSLYDLLQHIEKGSNYLSQLILAIETGQDHAECNLSYHTLNNRIDYKLQLTPIVFEENKYVVCTFEDITEFLFLQNVLTNQTNSLQGLHLASPIAAFKATVSGKVLFVNKGLVAMLGYSNEKQLFDLNPHQIWASISDREELLNLLRKEKAVNGFETRWRHKNNSIFWVSLIATGQFSIDDNISNFEVIAIDIDKKKKAGIELKHIQNHLNNIVESKTIELKRANDLLLKEVSFRQRAESISEILHAIAEETNRTKSLKSLLKFIHNQLSSIIHTPNLFFAFYNKDLNTYSFPYSTDQNDPVENFLGVDALKNSLTDYVRKTEEPLLITKEKHDEMLSKGILLQIGTPSEQWMGVPLKDTNGVWGVIVVQSYTMKNVFSQSDLLIFSNLADNISIAVSRFRAEQARKTIEALYNTVVDNLHQGAIMCDPEDNILFANKAFSNLVKIPQNELKNLNFNDLISKKDVGRTSYVRELRSIGKSSTYNVTLLRKDGERISVSVNGIPNFDSDQNFQGTIALFEVIQDVDNFVE